MLHEDANRTLRRHKRATSGQPLERACALIHICVHADLCIIIQLYRVHVPVMITKKRSPNIACKCNS